MSLFVIANLLDYAISIIDAQFASTAQVANTVGLLAILDIGQATIVISLGKISIYLKSARVVIDGVGIFTIGGVQITSIII